MNRFYNILMVVSLLLAAACLSLIVITSVENRRNLEQLLEDVKAMELKSIRMDEEAEALLKSLEEIHPQENEPNLRIPPL
jgi:hypothetical protein